MRVFSNFEKEIAESSRFGADGRTESYVESSSGMLLEKLRCERWITDAVKLRFEVIHLWRERWLWCAN